LHFVGQLLAILPHRLLFTVYGKFQSALLCQFAAAVLMALSVIIIPPASLDVILGSAISRVAPS